MVYICQNSLSISKGLAVVHIKTYPMSTVKNVDKDNLILKCKDPVKTGNRVKMSKERGASYVSYSIGKT